MIIAQSPRIPEYLRAFFSLMVQMWWHRFVDYEVTVSYTTNRGRMFFSHWAPCGGRRYHRSRWGHNFELSNHWGREVCSQGVSIHSSWFFVNCFSFKGGECYTHTHTQSNNMVHLRFSAPWKRRFSPNLQKNLIFRWTLLNFRGRVFTVLLWVVKIRRFEISTYRSIKYRWVSYSMYG